MLLPVLLVAAPEPSTFIAGQGWPTTVHIHLLFSLLTKKVYKHPGTEHSSSSQVSEFIAGSATKGGIFSL